MYKDHPDNILGVDSANNQFASTNVVANADGSMIERQEYLQSQIAALSGSLPGNFAWGVAPAATNSTTIVVIAALAGYGDDFFNDEYFMQVLKNANSAGNAPEKEVRKITDYATATGTFTCDAFSAAIEASDICLIVHESVVALGRDDANNIYASTAVVANADGSMIERLEYLQSKLGAAVGASISADIAAVKAAVDAVDDYVDTEVAAIKAETDKITAVKVGTDMIAGFVAGGGIGSGIARKTVTFANSGADIPLFTVTGDVIVRLVAVCGTTLESAGGCNIGVDAGAVAIIADTASTDLDANELWNDNSPDASVEAITTMKEYIIANGTDITLDIENAKQVDSGVINFYCIWTALSANGAVAAA